VVLDGTHVVVLEAVAVVDMPEVILEPDAEVAGVTEKNP